MNITVIGKEIERIKKLKENNICIDKDYFIDLLKKSGIDSNTINFIIKYNEYFIFDEENKSYYPKISLIVKFNDLLHYYLKEEYVYCEYTIE